MPIKLKRSSVSGKVPTTAQVELGELALNTFDGKLYTKRNNGTEAIVEIGAGGVTSVAGKTGAVTLAKADVGLGNVDNTSDANKPISTATQTALNGKAASTHSHAIADVTGLQTTIDGKLSGTSAQLAKAWVNFNGTGAVAIRASYNVSSITDNGLGDYTVNFTNPMQDSNYQYSGTGRRNASTHRPIVISQANTSTYDSGTSSFRFLTWVEAAAALEDPLSFNVTVFR